MGKNSRSLVERLAGTGNFDGSGVLLPNETIEVIDGVADAVTATVDELNAELASTIHRDFLIGSISPGEAMSKLLDLNMTPYIKDMMGNVCLAILDNEKNIPSGSKEEDWYAHEHDGFRFTVQPVGDIPNHPELKGMFGIRCEILRAWGFFPYCYTNVTQAIEVRKTICKSFNYLSYQVNFNRPHPVAMVSPYREDPTT